MIEALMHDGAQAIADAVISAAKQGDLTAARMVLDRIAPPRRDAPIVDLVLPRLKTAADATMAIGMIIEAISQGIVTPSEASTLVGLIERFFKSLEVAEFERRLTALEASR